MKNAFDMLGTIKTKSKLKVTASGVEKVRNTEEEDNHEAVVEWSKLKKFNGRRVFDYLIHHPSEGNRSPGERAKAIRMGMKKGILDFQLIMPIGSIPGKWIEMKAATGRWSDEQKAFRIIALEMGYEVTESRSAEDCIAQIEDWLARFAAYHKSG